VDLFGEQSVQVAVTVLEAAMLLLAASLLLLLSVHVATSAMPKPMLARVPRRTGRLVLPEVSEFHPAPGLETSLPTRGPPGSSVHRVSSPPGTADVQRL
jgi:hypothetical protein